MKESKATKRDSDRLVLGFFLGGFLLGNSFFGESSVFGFHISHYDRSLLPPPSASAFKQRYDQSPPPITRLNAPPLVAEHLTDHRHLQE